MNTQHTMTRRGLRRTSLAAAVIVMLTLVHLAAPASAIPSRVAIGKGTAPFDDGCLDDYYFVGHKPPGSFTWVFELHLVNGYCAAWTAGAVFTTGLNGDYPSGCFTSFVDGAYACLTRVAKVNGFFSDTMRYSFTVCFQTPDPYCATDGSLDIGFQTGP